VDKEELERKRREKPEGSTPSRQLPDAREQMPDAREQNGVPLGGVGTGKLEITSDGVFRHFTINNNYIFPIEEVRGTFFAFFTQDAERKRAKILQTRTLLDFPEGLLDKDEILMPSEGIISKGLYPKTNISYINSGVEVSLEAFSPIIPRDEKHALLPIVFFIFKIRNLTSSVAKSSVAFSWENINGCWGSKVSWDDFVPKTEPVWGEDRGICKRHKLMADGSRLMRAGLMNQAPTIRKCIQALSFHHQDEHPEVADFAYGDYTIAVISDEDSVTTRCWNPYSAEETAELWQDFSEDGRFENYGEEDIDSQKDKSKAKCAAALSSQIKIEPGEDKEVVFALAWNTPNMWGIGEGDVESRVSLPTDFRGKLIGHYYSNTYNNSFSVVKDGLLEVDNLREKVDSWQRMFKESNLLEWLKCMIINNSYVLTSNTFWAKDGRFSMIESPPCPCYGTLDQRFYGSIAGLLFFPELEHKELEMFAELSDKMFLLTGENEGQIYHDFGNNRLDALNKYGYNWIDLNPKFVLLAYRNYLWTGARDKLKQLYPKLKQVMEQELTLDENGDYLPEGYGNCNTYEGGFFETNSYDSSLWLASIKAYIEIARLMNEEGEVEKYVETFKKAVASFEERLWDDELGYYIKCTKKGSDDNNRSCRDDQLAGQWFADFLNLGKIVPPERINRALDSMKELLQYEINGCTIMRMQAFPGEESKGGCWPGYSIAHFACLAIMNGQVDLGIRVAQGIHNLIHKRYSMSWDQPLELPLDRRPRGDRYMNSPSAWHLLFAIQGFSIDFAGKKIWLRPNIPSEMKGILSTPLVTPLTWGWLDFQERWSDNNKRYEEIIHIKMDKPICCTTLFLKGWEGSEIQELFILKGNSPVYPLKKLLSGKGTAATLTIEFPEDTIIDDREMKIRVRFKKGVKSQKSIVHSP